jgi:hypothetical protein
MVSVTIEQRTTCMCRTIAENEDRCRLSAVAEDAGTVHPAEVIKPLSWHWKNSDQPQPLD